MPHPLGNFHARVMPAPALIAPGVLAGSPPSGSRASSSPGVREPRVMRAQAMQARYRSKSKRTLHLAGRLACVLDLNSPSRSGRTLRGPWNPPLVCGHFSCFARVLMEEDFGEDSTGRNPSKPGAVTQKPYSPPSPLHVRLSGPVSHPFKQKALRPASPGAKRGTMDTGQGFNPLTCGGPETPVTPHRMGSPSNPEESQGSSGFCLEPESWRSDVSRPEGGTQEPESTEIDIDFTPGVPRSEPGSLLLETRGVTSHPTQSVMWEREIVFRESILAKLRGMGKAHLAGKMVECHTIETFKRCTGCRKVSKFFNRCELFFCPICAPRLSRERKQAVEWWTKQIKQPKHLVLTVRNTCDLTTEYVKFLKGQLGKLRRSKVFRAVQGGFYSMEVTNEGRGWHVHFHLLIDAPWLCMPDVSETWGKLVGQDFAICKIKDCRGADYLKEVTKYAVKGSELARWTPQEIACFISTFDGIRFFGVFGSLYGKRTEWRAWIEAITEIKPVCSCGCDTWRLLSPEELLWEAETKGGLTGEPPPGRTSVPHNQADLALDGTQFMPWPD